MPDQHSLHYLHEQLVRQQLTLFIGADLPPTLTGLPSRADLARDLARRKGLDASLSLAEVTQRVSQAGNRWEFTDFIRNALDTTGKTPQPFHQQVASLVKQYQLEILITTAYDNLLELAFQQAGVGLNRVVRGSDVNFINPDRPTLIKLYGDAGQPDTLVVTDQDHSALLRDRDKEAIVDEVRRAFRRNTVLFLGYNLADLDFRFLFDQIAESRFARTAYPVWPGLPEADMRMWRDRGIVILDADPLGVLGDLVAPTALPVQPEALAQPVAEAVPGVWDTDALRQLLTAALDDQGLTELCFDYFPDVYEQFSGGMRKDQKIQQLLDYCHRNAAVERLLAQVKEKNPAQYTRFESRLRRKVSSTSPIASPLSKGEGEAAGAATLYGISQRWAVLVGVNDYDDLINYGKLQVCVKDVTAVREQLIAGGFDPARIRLLTDETTELPTRDNILAALKSVADATEPDDLLLFYYSGHGEEAGGESYLVARNGRRLVLSDTAVRLSRIKEIMEDAPARAKVMILDACHSGANIGSKGPKPMSEEFIRHVFEQAEGLAILASCKQGQLSYEWRAQERSVFTHYLLEALTGQADRDEKGFVTVQDANRHVVNGVKVWAVQKNVSQTPTLQSAVAGEIILARLSKPS